MINDIIDDILKTEAEAGKIIEDAKVKAREMISANKSDVDKLYEEAEAELKAKVEKIVAMAEAGAEKIDKDENEEAQKRIEEILKKAGIKFLDAVKIAEKALRD